MVNAKDENGSYSKIGLQEISEAESDVQSLPSARKGFILIVECNLGRIYHA